MYTYMCIMYETILMKSTDVLNPWLANHTLKLTELNRTTIRGLDGRIVQSHRTSKRYTVVYFRGLLIWNQD